MTALLSRLFEALSSEGRQLQSARRQAEIAENNAIASANRLTAAEFDRRYSATYGDGSSGVGLGMPAGYQGAYIGRLDTPWQRSDIYTGEWRDQYHELLPELRWRSRNLERNNWLACGVLDRATENVLGPALAIQPKTVSAEFNQAATRWWKGWAGTTACDIRGMHSFGAMMRLAYKAKLRDGDCGIVLAEDKNRNPKLQIIEADRIESPYGYGSDINTWPNRIIMGVEMDDNGKPVAFHVRYTDQMRVVRHERVDAADFIFLPRLSRYSNVRGEPAFVGGFTLFDQIVGYLDNVVVASRVGAAQAIIRKTKSPSSLLNNLANVTQANGTTQRYYPIQGGAINVMTTDDEMIPFTPSQPQQTLEAAMDVFCRVLGIKFGLTLEQVLLNFSKVNYSSGKLAQAQAETTASIEREDIAVVGVSRAYQWALSKAVKLHLIVDDAGNEVPAPESFWDHEWIPTPKASPDRWKDLKANALAIKLGISARSYLAHEEGYNFPDLCKQNKADRDLLAQNNLPVEVVDNVTESTTSTQPAEPDATAPSPDQIAEDEQDAGEGQGVQE